MPPIHELIGSLLPHELDGLFILSRKIIAQCRYQQIVEPDLKIGTVSFCPVVILMPPPENLSSKQILLLQQHGIRVHQ